MPILKKKLIKIGTERFHVKTMSYFLHSKILRFEKSFDFKERRTFRKPIWVDSGSLDNILFLKIILIGPMDSR
jgi:hypothetical protein